MTASVRKQDPNTQKIQKNAIHWDKTQPANFRGNPFFKLKNFPPVIFHRVSPFNFCLSVIL